MACSARHVASPLFAAALSLLSAGCLEAVEEQPAVCSVNGVGYAAGESFRASDSCNSCTCQADGQVLCTRSACRDGGQTGEGCNYAGKWHAAGETFLATDGCNRCSCAPDGTVACDLKACVDPTCTDADGTIHQPGETFPAADGCNTCTCSRDGQIGCTKIGCAGTCTHDGKTYKAGETFSNDCGSCFCGERAGHGIVTCEVWECNPQVCTKGDAKFSWGSSVICEDGCNSCLCSELVWTSTDAACPPLQKVERCPSNTRGIEKVRVLYRAGDKLAVEVGTGGCATDEPTFKLCFDGSFRESNPVQVTLDLVPSGATPTCSAWVTQQKVFDLSPLRSAFQASYPGSAGSIIVGLEDTSFNYTF